MSTLRAATSRAWPPIPADLVRPWLGGVGVLAGLAAIVGARWLATTRGLDALAVGAGFGLALGALWIAAARAGRGVGGRFPRPEIPHVAGAMVVGMTFGLGLVGLAVAGATIGGAPIVTGVSRPAAPFLPWALITIVVATAEEGILRGVLFDRVRAAAGVAPAIAVTTIAFAVMHVPLYGWHVVPLDLAVGLGLAGLRLSTRTVLAPAVAHGLADLATWWL